MDKLRRVTDLFVEGTELPLGADDSGAPVLVWVQKLNSFEVEEARRDGVAQRGLRLLELSDESKPELQAQRHLVAKMADHELRQARVAQMGDEIYLRVMNDIEADEQWVEKLGVIRRLPQLLLDAGAPADDPRQAQLDDLNREYVATVQERITKANRDALVDLEDLSRKDLEADFIEHWRQRLTLDDFIAERRKTEIFLAMRECSAVNEGGKWNHAECDHTQRLVDERSDVHTLPEGLLSRVVQILDGITVPNRESGNSGAPASSSVSSEPTSAAEATSAPSTPAATPDGAPTT